MQDAADFDDPSWGYPAQKEVTSATTVPRNVERAQVPHDLIPDLGSSNVGTVGKLADGLNKGVPIEPGLPI